MFSGSEQHNRLQHDSEIKWCIRGVQRARKWHFLYLQGLFFRCGFFSPCPGFCALSVLQGKQRAQPKMSQIWEIFSPSSGCPGSLLRSIWGQIKIRDRAGLGTEGLLNKITLPEHQIFGIKARGSEGRGSWRRRGHQEGTSQHRREG